MFKPIVGYTNMWQIYRTHTIQSSVTAQLLTNDNNIAILSLAYIDKMHMIKKNNNNNNRGYKRKIPNEKIKTCT